MRRRRCRWQGFCGPSRYRYSGRLDRLTPAENKQRIMCWPPNQHHAHQLRQLLVCVVESRHTVNATNEQPQKNEPTTKTQTPQNSSLFLLIPTLSPGAVSSSQHPHPEKQTFRLLEGREKFRSQTFVDTN